MWKKFLVVAIIAAFIAFQPTPGKAQSRAKLAKEAYELVKEYGGKALDWAGRAAFVKEAYDWATGKSEVDKPEKVDKSTGNRREVDSDCTRHVGGRNAP